MSRREIVRTACIGATVALPIAGILIWPDAGWPLVLFVLWTLAAAGVVIALQQREQRRNDSRQMAAVRSIALETLRHHRHDWMNEVQILYGYLKLGKPDKAIEIVERIKLQMENESRMARLAEPKLITFFHSFRATCNTVKLEVEIEDSFKSDGVANLERFSDAVIGLVNVIRYRSTLPPAGEENVLRLIFRSSDNAIQVEVKISGTYAALDNLPQDLEQALKGAGRLSEANRDVISELSGLSGSGQRMLVAFPLKEQEQAG